MRRKHLPEALIDAELPNSDSATGPWQQTMAAAAAVELSIDGWMTVFSSDEEVNPVDFEVFVLDHTGQSHNYTRPDGLSHDQLLEVRREQDTRKVVMYLTWPPDFKLFLPEKLRQAKGATKEKVQLLLKGHAEHVSFGECKDDQGNPMPKILIFIRHDATSSMAELAKVLPQLRYIDVGLQVLVKTNIGGGDRTKLGIKSCCYAPACVRGNLEPGRNGRPARPAPQCRHRLCALGRWAHLTEFGRLAHLAQTATSPDQVLPGHTL